MGDALGGYRDYVVLISLGRRGERGFRLRPFQMDQLMAGRGKWALLCQNERRHFTMGIYGLQVALKEGSSSAIIQLAQLFLELRVETFHGTVDDLDVEFNLLTRALVLLTLMLGHDRENHLRWISPDDTIMLNFRLGNGDLLQVSITCRTDALFLNFLNGRHAFGLRGDSNTLDSLLGDD